MGWPGVAVLITNLWISSCLWFKSLWPNDTLGCHRYRSILAQVMACSLRPWQHQAITWNNIDVPSIVNIVSGNGLLSDGTKPLSEKIQWHPDLHGDNELMTKAKDCGSGVLAADLHIVLSLPHCLPHYKCSILSSCPYKTVLGHLLGNWGLSLPITDFKHGLLPIIGLCF